MIISIKRDIGDAFEGDEYIIDLRKKFEGYEPGDLICDVKPFEMPLVLEIAIRKNGSLIFRHWSFNSRTTANGYLHTRAKPDEFTATPEQIDTVNGLFSGRIKFEGLKLAVGATLQQICPIDTKREEKNIGKKIFING